MLDAQEMFNTYIRDGETEGTRSEEEIGRLLGRRTEADQHKHDVACWAGTLLDEERHYNIVLKRLFTTLHAGGLIYKANSTWKKWSASQMPIASALSHGGRVMIELPRDESKAFEYFYWLWGERSAEEVFLEHKRTSATHGIKTLDNSEPTVPGVRKTIGELQGTKHAIRDVLGVKVLRHLGINIAMGGTGNINPFSRHKIAANGSHGHLYIFWKWPKQGKGSGILVGCEGSSPKDCVPDWNEVEKGRWMLQQWPKDQTGHLHTLGASGTFSPTGGMKWKSTVWHRDGPTTSKDAMFVDLQNDGRRRALYGKEFELAWLGGHGEWPS